MDQNDQNMAQNQQVVDNNQDVMPTSEEQVVEAQIDQSVTEDTSELSEPSPEQANSGDGDGQVKKPTRLERNLAKALEKNKTLKNDLDQVHEFLGLNSNSQMSAKQMESLFTKEEIETGEIDPTTLQDRVAKFVEQRVNDVLTQKEGTQKQRASVEKYNNLVESHVTELDELLTTMPELQDEEVADTFTTMYRKINYIGDKFIGKESPKEIADMMFGTARKIADRRVAELGGKVAKMADESAIVEGVEIPRNTGTDLSSLYQKAQSTGSDDDWTNYMKAKLFK